jgi:hypothetical protein
VDRCGELSLGTGGCMRSEQAGGQDPPARPTTWLLIEGVGENVSLLGDDDSAPHEQEWGARSLRGLWTAVMSKVSRRAS